MRIQKYIFVILLFLSANAFALQTFELPPNNDDVIGKVYYAYVKTGDTLATLAREYNVTFTELGKANPKLSKRIRTNDRIIIPSSYILPPTERRGIVINISEMRLYYYPENQNVVMTAPVSIGREGWETPVGITSIIEKIQGPEWHPPESIKAYKAQQGEILPDVIPPGPNNPLGQYAMRLALRTYLIHGTNDPNSIGRRVSSGCIRMYPEDIEQLFYNVPIGTKVTIINEPYKAGWYKGMLFFEAHTPVENNTAAQIPMNTDYEMTILQKTPYTELDWRLIKKIADQQGGVPIRIQ